MKRHRIWAEIDLQALGHNLEIIRARAGRQAKVVLVVKADAYGHGAVAIAKHALRCGVDALGVSTSQEALELRRAGIEVPILILGIPIEEELVDCLRHAVHIGVHSSDRRASLQALAREHDLRAQVHLNVDTGMGRLGVPPELALALLEEIHSSPNLDLAGIMSHIAAPRGLLEPSARLQQARFERLVQQARERGLVSGWVHLANSATLFTSTPGSFEAVRPGIAAYGALDPELDPQRELRPVLALRCQVVYLRDVPRGTPVGYGSTWCAEQATRIATLAVGYDDGVPWRLGGVGEVLVRGRRAPIIGRVSMDYTSIDVGHIPDVAVGDVATLIGRDGDQEIRVDEIARRARTIPYEITCSVGRRVARVLAAPAGATQDASNGPATVDTSAAATRRTTVGPQARDADG